MKNFEVNVKEMVRIAKLLENQEVVLYGAGKYGVQTLHNIQHYFPKIKVKYFIDDNLVRHNGKINNVEIISFSEAIKRLNNCFYVLITNYYVSDTLKKLESHQYDLSNVYFCSEFLIEDIKLEQIEENEEKLKKVYDLLYDYKSKLLYRTMIESRLTKNLDVISCLCEERQYFPEGDIFTISDREVFVDAGSFDGDTIADFLDVVDEKYQYIYAFEPDKTNFKRLQKKNFSDNIKLFNKGLYSESTQICFFSNQGGVCRVSEEGTEKVEVYKFDDLELPEERITFVKMDIEGSELKALEGMKNSIIKYKPKLAICIYHKFEDIWELPLYIKSLVPEYKLYIRNYTTYLDEIVLYATL